MFWRVGNLINILKMKHIYTPYPSLNASTNPTTSRKTLARENQQNPLAQPKGTIMQE